MSKIGIKKNIFIISFIFLLSLFLYLKFFGEKNKESIEIKTKIDEKTLYNSNVPVVVIFDDIIGIPLYELPLLNFLLVFKFTSFLEFTLELSGKIKTSLKS